jgi:maltose alpha-D-glucosyltransferase/alpha-amylase
MQWEAEATVGFSKSSTLYAPVIDSNTYGSAQVNVKSRRADPDSIWNVIRHMIAIRKLHPTFGQGQFEWLDIANESIAAFQKTYEDETILAIHNLSNENQKITYAIKKPVNSLTDLLTQKQFALVNGNFEIMLMPYEYLWLK